MAFDSQMAKSFRWWSIKTGIFPLGLSAKNAGDFCSLVLKSTSTSLKEGIDKTVLAGNGTKE